MDSINQALLRWASVLALLLVTTASHANQRFQPQLQTLIDSAEAPDGVVIELLAWDEQTWTWAAPLITEFRKQLLAKHPDTDVAVVSHGGEQFQLTKKAAETQPEAIDQLQSLTAAGVNLHVCGVHSGWQDVPEDAYLDIVDVSPSGPAQINDYIKLGYKQVLLSKPE